MLPIATNPNLNETDRSRAAQICFDTEYEILWNTDVSYLISANALDTHRDDAEQLSSQIISGTNADVDSDMINIDIPPVFTTEHVARYRLDNNPATLANAYRFFVSALAHTPNNIGTSDLNRGCELLLASTQLCQLDRPISDYDNFSCHFSDWLDLQLSTIDIANSSPNLESIAQCVMANTGHRERYLSFMRDYYLSSDNAFFQLTTPRLLNEYSSRTKGVIANALFAGILVSR
jgi:hypothetical protein